MDRFIEEISKYEKIHAGIAPVYTITGNKPPFVSSNTYGDGAMTTHISIPYIFQVLKQKQRAITILDYGCGKAKHTYSNYTKINSNLSSNNNFFSLMSGAIQSYYCYDPAVKKYNVKPSKGSLFDVVLMIDVGEHIPEEYVEEVVAEVFSYTKDDGLVILTISGIPSYQYFSDEGNQTDNLHITLKDFDWWKNIIDKYRESKAYALMYQYNEESNKVRVRHQTQSSNFLILPERPSVISSLDEFNFLQTFR